MQGAGISTSAGSKFTAGSVGVIHDYDRYPQFPTSAVEFTLIWTRVESNTSINY